MTRSYIERAIRELRENPEEVVTAGRLASILEWVDYRCDDIARDVERIEGKIE